MFRKINLLIDLGFSIISVNNYARKQFDLSKNIMILINMQIGKSHFNLIRLKCKYNIS